MKNQTAEEAEWLTGAEVAAMFRVDPKTIGYWAKTGKLDGITIIKTPGGHRRFKRVEVQAILEGSEGV